jgi:hypothetical protein
MKRKGSLWVTNVLVPLLVGACIYYFLAPEVIFVKHIDALLGIGFHVNNAGSHLRLVRFIRNYLPDMIWGYALVFALYSIIGNNAADLLKIFMLAFIFSTVLEILQLTSVVEGTFDVFDLLVEFLAEAIAVFIIKIHFMNEHFKEEEKEI